MRFSNRPQRLALALIFVLAVAVPALGQVDRGVIADPISRDELDGYAERLGLSEQQRRAVDRLHDTYLADYRAAQDESLAEFRRTHDTFGNTTTEISADVEAAKRAVRDVRKLHATLRSADERFFDQINPLLSEAQLVELPGLRSARARWRDLHGPAQLCYHPALDIDLTSAYAELAPALSPDLRAATDAIVARYASELGRAADRIDEFATDYNLDHAERLATARTASADPDAGDFAIRAGLLREGQTELARRAADIGALHRRMYESLAPLLPPEPRETLRRELLTRVYPGIPVTRGIAETELERVLGHDTLPPEVREQVEAERVRYFDAAERVITKMLDTDDARRRSNASHSIKMILNDEDYVYEDPKIFERQLATLKRELRRVNHATIERVQALLDEEDPGRFTLQRPPEEKTHPALASTGLHSSISTTDGQVTYGYKHIPIGQLLDAFGSGRRGVAPISKHDLTRWRRMLGLDADHAVLMDVLHDDYRDEYEDLVSAGDVAALNRARAALLALDEDGLPALPTENDVRDLFRRERAAIAAVRALDASFFEQLSVALDDRLSDIDRQRLERDRNRAVFLTLAPPPSYSLFTFGKARSQRQHGGERPDFDVAALLSELDLERETAEAIEPVVLDYEAAATALLERASDAVSRLDEERALLMARHLSFHSEDGLVAEGIHVPPSMDEVGLAMNEAFDELLALNRALRGDIESMLPEPNRSHFSASYKRAAWPRIFDDDLAVHEVLSSALALDDLEPGQRETLSETSLEYDHSYAALCDQMIEHAGDWSEQTRYRTERKELNERVRRDVGNILRPEQRQHVIGLANTQAD